MSEYEQRKPGPEPWWVTAANDPRHPDHEDAQDATAEAEAEWAGEWDSADSYAYQLRVEAGLEPEPELG